MKRLVDRFLVVSGVGLCAFGIIVLWASFCGERGLDVGDALLGLRVRSVLRLASVVIFFGSACLAGGTTLVPRCALLGWMALLFLLYDWGTRWCGGANVLVCLGNLDIGIPISPLVLHRLLVIGTFSILLGSGGLLAFTRTQEGQRGKVALSPTEDPGPSVIRGGLLK